MCVCVCVCISVNHSIDLAWFGLLKYLSVSVVFNFYKNCDTPVVTCVTQNINDGTDGLV